MPSSTARAIGTEATQITIEIDDAKLPGYEDWHLAMLWHVAQANPAPFGDQRAGELVERVGREIIRRWLAGAPVELWRHQGHHYYWDELRQLGKWNEDRQFTPHFAADVDALAAKWEQAAKDLTTDGGDLDDLAVADDSQTSETAATAAVYREVAAELRAAVIR